MSTAANAQAPLQSSGIARRRREQAKRSCARKVGWLAGLLQTQGHHTTGACSACPGCARLVARIDALEKQLQSEVTNPLAPPSHAVPTLGTADMSDDTNLNFLAANADLFAHTNLVADTELVVNTGVIADTELIVNTDMVDDADMVVHTDLVPNTELVVNTGVVADTELITNTGTIATDTDLVADTDMVAYARALRVAGRDNTLVPNTELVNTDYNTEVVQGVQNLIRVFEPVAPTPAPEPIAPDPLSRLPPEALAAMARFPGTFFAQSNAQSHTPG